MRGLLGRDGVTLGAELLDEGFGDHGASLSIRVPHIRFRMNDDFEGATQRGR
jgi:hypothetical protein